MMSCKCIFITILKSKLLLFYKKKGLIVVILNNFNFLLYLQTNHITF